MDGHGVAVGTHQCSVCQPFWFHHVPLSRPLRLYRPHTLKASQIIQTPQSYFKSQNPYIGEYLHITNTSSV